MTVATLEPTAALILIDLQKGIVALRPPTDRQRSCREPQH